MMSSHCALLERLSRLGWSVSVGACMPGVSTHWSEHEHRGGYSGSGGCDDELMGVPVS
jgi:hypothetical protein